MLLCGLCAFPATTLPEQGESGQHRGRRAETLFCRMGGSSSFQDGEPWSAQNYITRHLKYDPTLLGDKQQARGIYTMRINSYGEVYEAKSYEVAAYRIGTPSIGNHQKNATLDTHHQLLWEGGYRESVWTIPIFFKRNGNLIAHTAESHLEVGVPICYLNEQGDTIITLRQIQVLPNGYHTAHRFCV